MYTPPIIRKTRRILSLFLVALSLIGVRIWYLSIIQHDTYVELAKKPQRKIKITNAPRGTIVDRFGKPLAINKIAYSAAICYDQIREIPRFITQVTNGKKTRIYLRKQHVEKLAQRLGAILELDPLDLEDAIYGKAALFPNTPYTIKEGLDEKTYYSLRFLEKELPGLVALKTAKRFYPNGKTGCHILGFMGAISHNEYMAVRKEKKELQDYITAYNDHRPIPLPKGYASCDSVSKRLLDLNEKSYTIHAQVGKEGIENTFEESLRGTCGRHEWVVNPKGQFLSQVPGGRNAVPGDTLSLSISLELQELAEHCLIQSDTKKDAYFPDDKVPPPWIKGGAIVAMVPTTGEIVAFASYPRFDPNDFINSGDAIAAKRQKRAEWLETPSHVGRLWNGTELLTRETPDGEESLLVTWDLFLASILSKNHATYQALKRVKTVETAWELLREIQNTLFISKQPSVAALIDYFYPEHKTRLAPDTQDLNLTLQNTSLQKLAPYLSSIKYNDDKCLFLDVLRLIIDPSKPHYTHNLSLSTHFTHMQTLATLLQKEKRKARKHFHETTFRAWRKTSLKPFLARKRLEEKEQNTYARPYTDYLEKEETRQFNLYWQEEKWNLISSSLPNAYLKTLQPFDLLNKRLYGYYPKLKGRKGEQTQKSLACAFYPRNGYGFSSSYAFKRATTAGSLFKLITSSEALTQYYNKSGKLNPLNLTDSYDASRITPNGPVLGYTERGNPITRRYKGGRLPKSYSHFGRLNFLSALEKSSNIYFSLLASETMQDKGDLKRAAHRFGFGTKTNISLPGEYRGYLPEDTDTNLSALYSFAIGQHSLVVTPLQFAQSLTAIANGGTLLTPQILHRQTSLQYSPFKQGVFPYKDSLQKIGINFPLFSSDLPPYHAAIHSKPSIKSEILLPPPVRKTVLDGMHRVVWGEHGTARPHRIRTLLQNKQAMHNFYALKDSLVGKTSTAEVSYNPFLDRESTPALLKETWFGAIDFTNNSHLNYSEPNLVVIVYSRFGSFGKNGAPIAAQIIQKWRELSAQP